MRAIATKPSLSACVTAIKRDEYGTIIEEEKRTSIDFQVTDLPVYFVVCGLEGRELFLQRKWFKCGNILTKTTPVLDADGNCITLSDTKPDAIVLMPGHYFWSVKDVEQNGIDECFPEEFMFEQYGVDFQWAKCWMGAIS